MSAFKDALKLIVSGWILFFLILAFSPGLLDIEPAHVVVKPCPPFENTLKPNNVLDGVVKLFENKIEGPESIAVYKNCEKQLRHQWMTERPRLELTNGTCENSINVAKFQLGIFFGKIVGYALYTGLADGKIVRIKDDKVKTIAQIGKADCDGRWEEDVCGRPLGMRFGKNGTLFVADAYYGLYTVNVDSGDVTELYSSKTPIDGKQSFVVNDLDITKSGVVYFSDSARHTLKEGIIEMLEASPNGRVLKYDPNTEKTEVLVDGIAFANGIQLSPDEDYLLISETFYNRIMKYYLKGEKRGKLEVFVDGLPGVPDNIRLSPRGTYWISHCSTRLPDHPGLLDRFGDKPLVRKVVARFLHLLHSLVGLVVPYGPPLFKELQYKITHMHKFADLVVPNYGLVLEIDNKGQIIRSLHSPAGNVKYVSEVLEYDNSLYLGSPWHKFLGKVKL